MPEIAERWYRFTTVLMLSVLVSFILAIGHVVYGQQLITELGPEMFNTLDNYVFYLSFATGSLLSIGYMLWFKDLTEGLAAFLVLAWSLFGGLEDLFVYLLEARFPPAELPWIEYGLPRLLGNLLGVESIGGVFLLVSTLVSGIALVGVSVYLYRINDPDTVV